MCIFNLWQQCSLGSYSSGMWQHCKQYFSIYASVSEYVFLLTYLLHSSNIYFARLYVIQGAGEKPDAFVIEGP